MMGRASSLVRPKPSTRTQAAGQSLDDLRLDPISLLRGLPFVVKVEATGPATPTRRIVHIRDWHLVPRDQFALDLRSRQPSLSDAAIDREYERHVAEVEAVQLEQEAVLRCLAQHHGLGRVRVEGLTREEMEEGITLRLALLAARENGVYEWQKFRLESGAACLLASKGVLDVLPLEDEKALEQANPTRTGRYAPDPEAINRRRRAIVRIATTDPYSVIVLGASHDLTPHLPEGCQYLRVTVRSVEGK
jgi:hypothetical protein